MFIKRLFQGMADVVSEFFQIVCSCFVEACSKFFRRSVNVLFFFTRFGLEVFRGTVNILFFLTRFGLEVFRGTVNVFAVFRRCMCASHVMPGDVDTGSIGRDYAVWRRDYAVWRRDYAVWRRFEEIGSTQFGFLTVGLHCC